MTEPHLSRPAREDYPLLTKSMSGTLYLTAELDATRVEGQAALDEIDRLRALLVDANDAFDGCFG